jgi:hypothetical protein
MTQPISFGYDQTHFKVAKIGSIAKLNNEGVAHPFLNKLVFNMFGALTKVFIDQSTKFHGEFK